MLCMLSFSSHALSVEQPTVLLWSQRTSFFDWGHHGRPQGGGTDPWETGSYDLALEEAHIEDFNVVAYTSVIPAGEPGCPIV